MLIITALLLTFNCFGYELVSKKEILEKSKIWKEPKIAIWYYQGSDDNYHYFKYIDIGISEEYKVSKEDLDIENEQIKTSKRNNWRVMPWGPHAITAVKP